MIRFYHRARFVLNCCNWTWHSSVEKSREADRLQKFPADAKVRGFVDSVVEESTV